MSRTYQKTTKGRQSSNPSHPHVDVSRRSGLARSPKNECSVDLEKPERKRTNRKRARKCNPAPVKTGKTFNDFAVHFIAAFALAISLFVSSLCHSQQASRSASNAVAVLPSVPSIPVSGQWQMEVATDQATTYGVVFIKIDNAVLYGEGQDPVGAFRLDGKLWSNRIWFVKKYDEDACVHGAHRGDIVFDGLVSANPTNSNELLLQGKFETQVKSGYPTSYFQKTQWQTVAGRWNAHKIAELPAQLSMQMESRRAAWNPLKDLDAQPTTNLQQPVNPEADAAQKQSQLVAATFYCILAGIIITLFGWFVYAAYRYMQRLSETSN